MREHGVEVEVLRAIDHDLATGVYPDMTEHGWATDEWPEIYPRLLARGHPRGRRADLAGRQLQPDQVVIERLYSLSGMLNEKGQYLFYGRAAGCLITGNEDGIKHCAQNVLYSLQHIGYTIPPTPTRLDW